MNAADGGAHPETGGARVLLIVDHPNAGSFTHGAAAQFAAGARASGHTVEIADLHAEGFDPRWSAADIAADTDGLPEDVRREQIRIERAGVLAFAFPLYWYGMPAMLKGWIDRVWTFGWAFDQIEDPYRSLQPARRGVFLVPAGGKAENWKRYGLDAAMQTIWRDGLLGYLGIADPEFHFLNGSEGSDARRARLLEKAEAIGRDLGDRP